MSELINEDLFSDLEVYYAKVGGYDSLDWGNMLLCNKIKEGERQERLGKLSLGDIFTTGPPQEDSDRYYSSWKVAKFRFIFERPPPPF